MPGHGEQPVFKHGISGPNARFAGLGVISNPKDRLCLSLDY